MGGLKLLRLNSICCSVAAAASRRLCKELLFPPPGSCADTVSLPQVVCQHQTCPVCYVHTSCQWGPVNSCQPGHGHIRLTTLPAQEAVSVCGVVWSPMGCVGKTTGEHLQARDSRGEQWLQGNAGMLVSPSMVC